MLISTSAAASTRLSIAMSVPSGGDDSEPGVSPFQASLRASVIWAPLLRSTIAAEQVPAPATSNRGVLLSCLMSVI